MCTPAIIICERFRCILFALYYFRVKLGQNVEKTMAIIRRNIAKILVVSTIYVYTMNIGVIAHQFILNSV